jgi:hypothetical protein
MPCAGFLELWKIPDQSTAHGDAALPQGGALRDERAFYAFE